MDWLAVAAIVLIAVIGLAAVYCEWVRGQIDQYEGDE